MAYRSCESRTSPAFTLVLVFISVSPRRYRVPSVISFVGLHRENGLGHLQNSCAEPLPDPTGALNSRRTCFYWSAALTKSELHEPAFKFVSPLWSAPPTLKSQRLRFGHPAAACCQVSSRVWLPLPDVLPRSLPSSSFTSVASVPSRLLSLLVTLAPSTSSQFYSNS